MYLIPGIRGIKNSAVWKHGRNVIFSIFYCVDPVIPARKNAPGAFSVLFTVSTSFLIGLIIIGKPVTIEILINIMIRFKKHQI